MRCCPLSGHFPTKVSAAAIQGRPYLPDNPVRVLDQRVPGETQDVPPGIDQNVLPLGIPALTMRVAVPCPPVHFDCHQARLEDHVDLEPAAPRVRAPARQTRVAQEPMQDALGFRMPAVACRAQQA